MANISQCCGVAPVVKYLIIAKEIQHELGMCNKLSCFKNWQIRFTLIGHEPRNSYFAIPYSLLCVYVCMCVCTSFFLLIAIRVFYILLLPNIANN